MENLLVLLSSGINLNNEGVFQSNIKKSKTSKSKNNCSFQAYSWVKSKSAFAECTEAFDRGTAPTTPPGDDNPYST